jgi:hypothetical protein
MRKWHANDGNEIVGRGRNSDGSRDSIDIALWGRRLQRRPFLERLLRMIEVAGRAGLGSARRSAFDSDSYHVDTNNQFAK